MPRQKEKHSEAKPGYVPDRRFRTGWRKSKKVTEVPETPTPEEIRRVRMEANLSQEEAASFLYRTSRNWEQWERGERGMKPELWELFKLKLHQENLISETQTE